MEGHGAIDEQVRELVRLHRPELERLVDQALEHELAQLVEQRLAARNGNGAHRPDRTAALVETAAATKRCAGPCGRTLPATAFEKRRGKCRECRRAENREREQRRAVEQAPTGPDRPAITAHELAKRVHRPTGALDGAALECWLVDERLATIQGGRLEPTVLGLELAAGLSEGGR